ncbi:Uncharacterised protein [Neisseria meningitidis]|nr:Uncharacterised protein [Neisseria meningitidis]
MVRGRVFGVCRIGKIVADGGFPFRQCDRAHLRPLDRMCRDAAQAVFSPNSSNPFDGDDCRKDIADGFYALCGIGVLDCPIADGCCGIVFELRHICQIVDARHLVFGGKQTQAVHNSNV